MSKELDEAIDAIPDITEQQLQMLIDYQLKELALYEGNKKTRKKDQPEEDVIVALGKIVEEQSGVKVAPVGKFPRRF
jgi:hypothetical protein